MLQYKLPHCWIVFLLLLIGGCQSPVTINDTSIPADMPDSSLEATLPAELLSDSETDLINAYLDQARVARQQNRLTTPVDDNAYLRYLQVLALAPEHPAALTGLTDLADQYLAWARREVNTGNLRRATDYTNKARSIDENHLGISAVEAMIRDRHTTQYIDYPVPTLSLNTFSETNKSQADASIALNVLMKVARQIDQSSTPIVIFANSDALGRRIYQYLNSLTPDRISAQFELREKTLIRLMAQ